MGTIRVTGRGKVNVHPDMTRITMVLEQKYPEYGETMKRSSEATEEMNDLMAEFGFERCDLKTLSFTVEPEYESYKENGAYKQRLTGYSFRHVLKIEFMSDNILLGKILYRLAHSPLHPEFRLSYTVKDPEAAKNELLGKAVRDATEKARVICEAARVRMFHAEHIDYSWNRVEIETEPVYRSMSLMAPSACEEETYDMDIEPDDIELEDTVTIEWETGAM